MNDSSTKDVLSIFLASPGDVQRERNYVEKVVKELNHSVAPGQDIVLEVKTWQDDTFPGHGDDAQALINAQMGEMKKYSLFVGVMWNRLGTPTSRAKSGTVEEFERAVAAFKQYGRPQIWWYFRDAPITLNDEEQIEQRRKVIEFKKQMEANGRVEYYTTRAEFRNKFSNHMQLWLSTQSYKLKPSPKEPSAENQLPKEQNKQNMSPLSWEDFSEELIKTLDVADKVWLFSRTGMGWWGSKSSGGSVISASLFGLHNNQPNDEKLRFLFLDPNGISFELDTKYFWKSVSTKQAVNNLSDNLAKEAKERKPNAIKFYNSIHSSLSLRVIDILIPLSIWIIWPQGKQQPKLFVEIPTNRDQYERNLYLPIDASSGDTKQQRLYEQYYTLFNRLWNDARIWNP